MENEKQKDQLAMCEAHGWLVKIIYAIKGRSAIVMCKLLVHGNTKPKSVSDYCGSMKLFIAGYCLTMSSK